MTKGIVIKTINGEVHYYDYNDIYIYDFEYKPSILRIDLKDGSFVEYTRRNLIYVRLEKSDEDKHISGKEKE